MRSMQHEQQVPNVIITTACDSWDIKTRQEAHCKGAQCQEHMKNLLFFSLALGLQGVK